MATAKEEREGKGSLHKAADDEPVFVLRARDAHAPGLVEHWSHLARGTGCPDSKVMEAAQLADSMRAWQRKHGSKAPD